MNKGQFRVLKRTQKDYTLAFKLQVVDEVEKGELPRMLLKESMGYKAMPHFSLVKMVDRLAPKTTMGKNYTPKSWLTTFFSKSHSTTRQY
jgi:hypothetical protein